MDVVEATSEPAPSLNTLRRILVATDGSGSSADALALAVDLAAEHDSELAIAHAVPLVDTTSPLGTEASTYSLRHDPTTHDDELLGVSLHVLRTSRRPVLIVPGTHGPGTLGRVNVVA